MEETPPCEGRRCGELSGVMVSSTAFPISIPVPDSQWCPSQALVNRVVSVLEDPWGVMVGPSRLTEWHKLEMIPLLAHFLPAASLKRTSIITPVKALIKGHLDSVFIPSEDRLLRVLKSVADNWVISKPTGRNGAWGMPILRTRYATMLRRLEERQGNSCWLCRADFVRDGINPSLDHIIPYRIGGNREENSQLLCEECNGGKGQMMSSLQVQDGWNWLPGIKRDCTRISKQVRYIALASSMGCDIPGCISGDPLLVLPQDESRIAVVSNLKVVCRAHR